MSRQRVATAEIEFTANDSRLAATFQKIKSDSKSVGQSFTALSQAMDDAFGTKLEQRARASATAIAQIGGATKLTDAEAKRHLATLDAWIAKSHKLGQDVPSHILQTRDALKQVTTEAQKTPSLFSTIGSGAKAMMGVLGVAFTVNSVKNFIGNVIETASNVEDLSKKIGVSREAVQRWSYAIQQSGGTIDTVDRAVAFMNKTLAEGDKSTVGALKQAGLSFEQIRQMRPEDAFNAIVKGIEGIEDPMTRARVATQLFGRTGQELLPAIAEGFAAAAAGATVMSDETVKRLDKAGDAWTKFGNLVTIYTGEVLAETMAVAEGWIATITRMTSSWSKFVETAKIVAAGSLTGFSGTMAALKAIDSLDTPAGEDPKVAEERRKRAVQDAIARAKAAAEEEAAQRRGVAAARERLELDKRMAAARIPLTEIQKELVRQYLEEGQSLSDIAAKLRVSEVAVRNFADAQKEAAKQSQEWSKTVRQIELDAVKVLDIVNAQRAAKQREREERERQARLANDTQLLAMEEERAQQFVRMNGDSLANQLGQIHQHYEKRRQALDKNAANYAKALAAIDEMEKRSAAYATAQWNKHLQEMEQVPITYRSIFAQIGHEAIAAFSSGGLSGLAGFGRQFGADFLGEMLSWIPGIGPALRQLAGPIVDGLLSLFGGGTRGRDSMRNFFTEMGGEDELRRRLVAGLGERGHDLMRDLYRIGRDNKEQAERTIAAVRKALEEIEAKQAKFNDSLSGTLQRVKELGGVLPDSLLAYLRNLEQAGTLTEENIGLLNQLTGTGTVTWQQIEEAANRYGIAQGNLGQSFHALKLHDAWQQLIDDIDLFERGNVDVNALLVDMADDVSALVQQSIKFGTEIPENMRPWIQKLIDAGLLLDESGEKITDIGKMTFGETLQTSLQRLIEAIQALVDEFNRVPDAVAAIPRRVDIDVNTRYSRSEAGAETESSTAAMGGLVTAAGVQHFASGGLVSFRPRGTDTVPAMLTPGEGVLNLRAMNLIGAEGLRALNAGRAGAGAIPAIEGARSLSIHVDASGAYFDSEQRVDQLAKKIVRAINHNKGGTRTDLFKKIVRAINHNKGGTRTDLFGRGTALGTI